MARGLYLGQGGRDARPTDVIWFLTRCIVIRYFPCGCYCSLIWGIWSMEMDVRRQPRGAIICNCGRSTTRSPLRYRQVCGAFAADDSGVSRTRLRRLVPLSAPQARFGKTKPRNLDNQLAARRLMEKQLGRKRGRFSRWLRLASFWGLPAPRAAKVCATRGRRELRRDFAVTRGRRRGGRGCKTNPILRKPVWKSYQNEAKNEPKLGCAAGARGAVCGWEIILFIWVEVWQLHGVCDV